MPEYQDPNRPYVEPAPARPQGTQASGPIPNQVATGAPPAGPFDHMDTAYLTTARKQLMSNIPGDPTWSAHVGNLMRSLISWELGRDSRRQRDDEAAKLASDNLVAKQQQDLAVKQEAEKAAISPQDEKAQAELAAKHERELADIEQQNKRNALAAQQLDERKEFERHQQEARNSLVDTGIQADARTPAYVGPNLSGQGYVPPRVQPPAQQYP